MGLVIDGTQISMQIKDELKEQLQKSGKIATLAVVQVGGDPASSIYVRNKKKACEYVGIQSLSYELDEKTTTEELLKLIYSLNSNDKVTGILVQLPLPEHIDEGKIIKAIRPDKDVDGFHPESIGSFFIGADGFVPCTPMGVVELLKRSGIEIAGKECVVLGRSNNVGKPMALLMLRENATVTIVHSKTKNIKEITRRADILIVAIGRPKFITKEYIKEGVVIIDVGMHRDQGKHLCGDVDFQDVENLVSAITPVPGGVGPMTVTMLMKNCLKAISN